MQLLESNDSAAKVFKHGHKDPNAIIRFRPSEANLRIVDYIDMYNALYGRLPVFMTAFALRLAFEEPELIELEVLTTKFLNGVAIDGLAELDRAAFLNVVLKRITDSAGFHSEALRVDAAT